MGLPAAGEILPGDPLLLGGTSDGEGVNFALFSEHAERVELCIYDEQGRDELARYDLPERSNAVWHGYLPGLSAAFSYGYRVHGRYAPQEGHRFNPHKLLLDPYAKLLRSAFTWHDAHFGYDANYTDADGEMDCRDNAQWMPKAAISAAQAVSSAARAVAKPWHESIIYELNLRGFTLRHPGLAEAERGRFAGLSNNQVVDYLRALGITTVELLPVQCFIDEYTLHQRGLRNFWGYNPLNYFAPHQAYYSGSDAGEIRHAIQVLHDAGIEVILDVVYNHTAEGSELGPTLSYRGIDNRAYYRLHTGDARQYVNDTGCGNTLDIRHPRVLQLVMDSLRHWVNEYGVDGFRFDLATILGRTSKGFDPRSPLFQAIAQDPLLSRRRLVAEPWDVGPGGYQLGGFPAPWSEWNDRYRDTVRRFWRGDEGVLPELARRVHGSSDLFERGGRDPSASVNFITAHDGFTLRDLVSYNQRHNEANGEDNRDGHAESHSFNYGAEGQTGDPAINALRLRQSKNMLSTLLLSQGIPMLTAGDELGRSQGGNNNAYCQDNETSWMDWSLVETNQELLQFTQQLVAIRQRYPVARFAQFTHAARGLEQPGIHWLSESGTELDDASWHDPDRRVIGYLMLPGAALQGRARDHASALLVFMNSGEAAAALCLPDIDGYGGWQKILDTAATEPARPVQAQEVSTKELLAGRSVQVYSTKAREVPRSFIAVDL